MKIEELKIGTNVHVHGRWFEVTAFDETEWINVIDQEGSEELVHISALEAY